MAVVAESERFELSTSITYQLLDVEILYLLNQGPKLLEDLQRSLSQAFDVKPEATTLSLRVRVLEEKGVLIEVDPNRARAFAITPIGLRLLSESIDSVSRIALTMQLGLNQKLVRA